MSEQRKKRGRPPGSKNKINIKVEENDDLLCKMCKLSFTSTSELQSHLGDCKYLCKQLQFKAKPNYYCDKCSKKFKLQSCFKTHLLNEHSETPNSVPCEQCHVVCPNIEVLEAHIANVHERSIFECQFCDKKFVRQAHVIRHMSQTGCDGKGKVLYPCEICSKVFSRKDNLMVHLRLNHISKKNFNCKNCSFTTNNFAKLVIHDQSKHQKDPHFECHHCGKVTGSRAAISKHLEIHGEKKYKCDVCGHNTYTIEVMRRHVLTHIPNKPHKCKICGSSYIQKLQLDRHMLKHVGFKCFKCGLTFEAKSKFLAHDRIHVKKGLILCPFEECEYSKKPLADMETYNAHVKEHNMTDNKSYECNVCNKTFNCEPFLRRHVSTHALERARRCMYCVTARAYARGEQLVRHVRNKHPDVFRARLQHVRDVLGSPLTGSRVTKSEMESVLNVLDAETDRILEDYGPGVLYGGLQEDTAEAEEIEIQDKNEESPLMSETELEENLRRLLSQLIELDVLEYFGWPDESVDTVLEKVIEKMGARAAPRDKWSRVQRLRENTKHLFLHAVEDAAIARMLDTHTIDQVVKHILAKVTVKTEDTSPKKEVEA